MKVIDEQMEYFRANRTQMLAMEALMAELFGADPDEHKRSPTGEE